MIKDISYESIKEIIDKTAKRLKEENEMQEHLLSNDDYLIWLDIFTKSHGNFTTDEWDYNVNDINKDDMNKLKLFKYLFEGIKEYAMENAIRPIREGSFYSEMYKLHYNNNYYLIGLVVGQGSYYFCQRKEYIVDSINYDDIMKKTNNVKLIKKHE